jgi:thiosulfate/3-mercaptopyruvate sulfurtransferase
MKLSPLISAEELLMLNKQDIIIIEAGSRDSAYKNHLQDHLDGALYIDLNKDLAEIPTNAKNGGRHPLPSLENFSNVLQKLGIEKKSHLIIYDDKKGANASARFWWMLKAVGFEKIQVLDGGFQVAKAKGLPVKFHKVIDDICSPSGVSLKA